MKRYLLLLMLYSTFYAQEIIFTIATCNMLRHSSYRRYALQPSTAQAHALSDTELLTQTQRRNLFSQAFHDPLQFKGVDILCLQEWDAHIADMRTIPYNLFTTQRLGLVSAETTIRFVDVATLINSSQFSVIEQHILELSVQTGQPKADRGLLLILQSVKQPQCKLSITNCHIPWHTEHEAHLQLHKVQEIITASTQHAAHHRAPIIICGDFNYNTYAENSTHNYFAKRDKRPYQPLQQLFPLQYWVDAGYWDADFDQQKVLPTSYMEGFERNDYIFFTKEPLQKKAGSWKLELVGLSIYPSDLRNLLKHRKRTGTLGEFDISIDGPVADGYFSDHAILKATFKLTIQDRLSEFMKNLELDLRNLMSK